MSADLLELLLLGLAAAAGVVYATFSIHFGVAVPWWRTTSGRALMVSSPAVALLILMELYFEFAPASYRVELVAGIAAFALILAGGLLKYGSFLHERRRGRARRSQR